MNTLLVKDLSRVDELDREESKAICGGILTITNPNAPGPYWPLPGPIHSPWPPVPLPFRPVPTGGCNSGPVFHPYGQLPQDPRNQTVTPL